MATPNTNWVYEKAPVSEKDKRALEKAKLMEKKDIRNGYRWFRVNERTKVLIECDKHGNPTKRGLEHIERFKKL